MAAICIQEPWISFCHYCFALVFEKRRIGWN